MSTEFKDIKFYSDKECTIPLELIEWNNGYKLTLVNGEEITLKNTAMAGQLAIAIIYVKNEMKHRFGVTKLTHSDERVKLSIANPWLLPNSPVKVTVSYKVPSIISSKNIIREGKIKIGGYYVVEVD